MVVELAALYNRVRVLPNGTIVTYLDCCAVEDGIPPVLIDHFQIEITPLDDAVVQCRRGCDLLSAQGFDNVAPDALAVAETLCHIEHTSEVIHEFENPQPLAVRSGITKEVCFSLADVMLNGTLAVRFLKCVLRDGVNIHRPEYWRTTILPHYQNPRGTLESLAQLALDNGDGPLIPGDIDRVLNICGGVHTERVKAAWWVAEAKREIATQSGLDGGAGVPAAQEALAQRERELAATE